MNIKKNNKEDEGNELRKRTKLTKHVEEIKINETKRVSSAMI